jgi:hypothetical protein
VRRQIFFWMQVEFRHFGRETIQCDAGITGGIDEMWLVQVGPFLREFWVHRRGAGGGGRHFVEAATFGTRRQPRSVQVG